MQVQKTEPDQAPVDPEKDKRDADWVRFCTQFKDRIDKLPITGKRKVVPCAWDKKTEQWVWISRQLMRHSKRKHAKLKKR